jgi:ABC-type Fe3+ transport system substrate-binding protein
MALSANALTYAYNTAAVRPEDAPKSALDFLKPMFQGKVISVYPADDDAALYLFHGIVKKYGWDWMDKYTANKPNYVQGHLPVARSVASGENIVTLDASSSVWPFKREGKLEVVFSEVDETPVFTLTGGIFKDAPHPNAAKLYLTWFLAKEQQAKVGSFSSRADVPPPEGFKPLTSYKRKRLPGVHARRQADRGIAQAHGRLHRPAGEQRRRALIGATSCPRLAGSAPIAIKPA